MLRRCSGCVSLAKHDVCAPGARQDDHLEEVEISVWQRIHATVCAAFPRFNGEPVDTISPTLGFNIKTVECPATTFCASAALTMAHSRYEGYKLNIWDVGGQKTIRSYWRT